MANDQKKSASGGYIGVRLPASQPFLTPPGTLGFSNLIEPDSAFDTLKFTANWHFTPEAAELMAVRIDTKAVDPLWAKFKAEFEEKKGAKAWNPKWENPVGTLWIENHEKQPSEQSRIQLPHIQFHNAAEYRDQKTKEMRRKVMRASGVNGESLDLEALNPWMGTIFQAILQPSIFVSPIQKVPALTFALQGIRVIKLVTGGAGQARSIGAVEEEDMDTLGQGFEADDLSRYARSSTTEKPKRHGGANESPRGEAYAAEYEDDELDDDIPF